MIESTVVNTEWMDAKIRPLAAISAYCWRREVDFRGAETVLDRKLNNSIVFQNGVFAKRKGTA